MVLASTIAVSVTLGGSGLSCNLQRCPGYSRSFWSFELPVVTVFVVKIALVFVIWAVLAQIARLCHGPLDCHFNGDCRNGTLSASSWISGISVRTRAISRQLLQ